jgi:hypothetical protein
MPFDNVFFQILIYSSLISFNLLMILGIVATIMLMTATSSLKNKAHYTLDQINASAFNIGEMGLNAASFLGQFLLFNNKKGFFGKWFR